MSDNFEKFVSESTGLHKETLTEQIRMSEDVNKYSVWLLGLSTAGVAVLIIRFEAIIKDSWVQSEYIKVGLILIGTMFLVSVFLGAWHQRYSITERNCYRVLISLFGAQKIIPFFRQEGYPADEIPEDMHQNISDGQLLNFDKIPKFESTRKQAGELSGKLSLILIIQQLLVGIGYVLLFIFSIPA